MKNSQLLTEWLDLCEETNRLMIAARDNVEALKRYDEHIRSSERADYLWGALQADGWSVAELDAAYARRFGLSDEQVARLKAMRRG